jgi:putative hydrolase
LIYGDYHTHTTYSHGKNSIEENALSAIEKGIKEIAITDHGLNHLLYGMKRRNLKKVRDEIDALNIKYPMIKILFGIESNLISGRDGIDLRADDLSFFDVILCGYHVAVRAHNPLDQLRVSGTNFLGRTVGYTKRAIRRNTKLYIDAIKKNNIDIITHINYKIRADCREVAKAAFDYGTYIELSGKKMGCTDEDVLAMADTGVSFVLNSDAHTRERIGNVDLANDLISRLNLPRERLKNISEAPRFKKH